MSSTRARPSLSPVLALAALLALLPSALALSILSPPSLARDVESVLFNHNLGPSLDPTADHDLGVVVPVVVVGTDVCADIAAGTVNVSGAVVVIDSQLKKVRRVKEERKDALCVDAAGAVAVMRAFGATGVAGIQYNWNDHLSNGLGIPFLASTKQDWGDALDAFRAGNTNITAHLRIDKNRWVVFWDSTVFTVFFTALLTALNLVGVLMALHSIRLNFDRYTEDPDNPSPKRMLAGSAVEFVACLMRAAYCAAGGFFSTSRVDTAANLFLLSIVNPLEVTTNLIATDLFLVWGAFGEVELRRKAIVERFMAALATVLLILQTVVCALQAFTSTETTIFFALNSGLFMVVSLVTISLFYYFGFKFVRRMAVKKDAVSMASSEMVSKRKRTIAKAIKWIMLSGALQLVPILGIVLGVNTEFFISPAGFHTTLGMMFYGLTLGAMAQLRAFTPVARKARADKQSLKGGL